MMALLLVVTSACDESTPADPIRVGSIEVTPRLTTARVGTTQQLTATAKDASGGAMAGETITWRSSDPAVATVSTSGVVTLVGAGSTAILATARGTSGFATIVSDANVATVAMSASTLNVGLGQSIQLTATPQDPAGRSLFRPVTWASSTPTVATVSATGLVTSVSAGTTTVTATSEGKVGTVAVTIVPPPPVNTITVAPNSGFLPTAIGVPLAATLRDASNNLLTDRVVAWSTSASAVATVSATGLVTAQSALGSVTITASSEGKSGTATFTTLQGLRSATAFPFANSAVNTSTFFAVYVPAGSTNLSVVMSGGTGDPDLYVYRPGLSLSGAATCASEANGPGETCTLATPAAGVWVVEVFAFTTHTGTSITATVTPTPP